MTQRNYNLLTGVMFAVIALLHAIRFVGNWAFVVGSWDVPKLASAVAVLVAAYLAFAAFKLNRSSGA